MVPLYTLGLAHLAQAGFRSADEKQARGALSLHSTDTATNSGVWRTTRKLNAMHFASPFVTELGRRDSCMDVVWANLITHRAMGDLQLVSSSSARMLDTIQ